MESARRASGTDDADSAYAAAPGESVLLCSSPMDRPPVDAVTTTDAAAPASTNVLAVALDGSVDDVADAWLRDAGRLPDRLAVVTVGESARGAAAAASGGATGLPDGVSTASVSSPGDLTGLGIKLSQCLSSWEGGATTVRFDSLTTLLQFADLKRVFRFVHVLTGRLDSADAVGYFHVDPGAHDDQTLATLRGLFDTVLEVGPDGEWVEA
ncbi:DUF7504 family protein [Halosegnis marinus]|uniref:DUF4347 domain-containing protein n=2 Tax=Halosegnis marinus TaxID=3034023 RepID=A0ABD5ZKU0_9EURY|nr:hypothetical protein [Halosegnis sp. DT85]